jgi:serine phosphatase RsbU (regulator of sigma subunit)
LPAPATALADDGPITVIAAVYDRNHGELAYAKAGHAPPSVIGTAH